MNNDGVIDSSDLKNLMDDMGNDLGESEIFDMIQEADKNGDGVVDYEGGVLNSIQLSMPYRQKYHLRILPHF